MKQEEKELLLFDISSRFPCGLHIKTNMEKYPEIILDKIDKDKVEDSWYFNGIFEIIDCKPYLRPMSSMTAEEEYEYHRYKDIDYAKICEMEHKEMLETTALCFSRAIDWLNAHHFDYRGLIEKGLALEAPEGMYQ